MPSGNASKGSNAWEAGIRFGEGFASFLPERHVGLVRCALRGWPQRPPLVRPLSEWMTKRCAKLR
eukprot:3372434-Pyramimonas_sp.AAC.1